MEGHRVLADNHPGFAFAFHKVDLPDVTIESNGSVLHLPPHGAAFTVIVTQDDDGSFHVTETQMVTA